MTRFLVPYPSNKEQPASKTGSATTPMSGQPNSRLVDIIQACAVELENRSQEQSAMNSKFHNHLKSMQDSVKGGQEAVVQLQRELHHTQAKLRQARSTISDRDAYVQVVKEQFRQLYINFKNERRDKQLLMHEINWLRAQLKMKNEGNMSIQYVLNPKDK